MQCNVPAGQFTEHPSRLAPMRRLRTSRHSFGRRMDYDAHECTTDPFGLRAPIQFLDYGLPWKKHDFHGDSSFTLQKGTQGKAGQLTPRPKHCLSALTKETHVSHLVNYRLVPASAIMATFSPCACVDHMPQDRPSVSVSPSRVPRGTSL